jgi:hypothetical protein
MARRPPGEVDQKPCPVLARRAWLGGLVALAIGPSLGCAPTAVAAPVRVPVAPEPPPRVEHRPPPEPSPAEPARECVLPGPGPLLALADRTPDMETGKQFLTRTASLGRAAFEREVLEALSRGNVPPFERRLLPLELSAIDHRGKQHAATVYVACDYLAIGSDEDFLRIPLTPATAQRVATLAKCVLPTKKLVDEIYRHAAVKLPPKWIEGGPDILNRWEFMTHNAEVEAQRAERGCRNGQLTAGDKKDIVITNRLVKHPGKVAIYGWHKDDERVIQKLSTAHTRIYADYSHGARLVHEDALVDGETRKVVDVLRDPLLAALLSDEGTLKVIAYPLA